MPPNQTRNDPRPLPELATWLAWQHQQEQESVAARAAIGLGLLWPILQFSRLDETTPPWLHAVALEIEKNFNASVELGSALVQETLWAVEPTAGEIAPVSVRFPVEVVRDSMRSNGPSAVKHDTKVALLVPEADRTPGQQLMVSTLEADSMSAAKVDSTGAGIRHVMDGGRTAVDQRLRLAEHTPEAPVDQVARKRKQRVIGYARFTDSDPCYFCAMLASRGAVYLSEGSFKASNKKFEGDGVAKVHDHCQCSLRPVFSLDDGLDERAKYFFNMWVDAQKNRRKDETAINAYRRQYVPPPPYVDAPVVDLSAVRGNRRRLVDVGFKESSPQVRFYDRAIEKLASG